MACDADGDVNDGLARHALATRRCAIRIDGRWWVSFFMTTGVVAKFPNRLESA
ncbi:hypothetical protein C8E00_103174 [Chromohalobacter marismortui]|uniref:Uncharacterized protein n=1 Tax=Chromohalobacter marismortui TaxID=42055 RepID=A0A4R7NQA1_9GAMM|nr:hypothetical protein C8E00_103174 [Chromohalobacter marismortui]